MTRATWTCFAGAALCLVFAVPVLHADSDTKTAPATIVVTLPADAKLEFDGAPTTSTGAKREFVSPALPFGKNFKYSLKVTYQGHSVTHEVPVKANETSKVDFVKDYAGAIMADPPKGVGPYSKPGFVTFVKDGRLWVFRMGSKELQDYKKDGEPAKQVTRVGDGPEGMTLKGPDAETLDAYLKAPKPKD
jgi:uncharacterized protein (TIGR03000 family)